MRIGRLEFGTIRNWDNKIVYGGFSFREEGGCSCWVLTLGFFYITLLSKECISNFEETPKDMAQQAAELRSKAVSRSEIKRINVLLDRPINEGISVKPKKRKTKAPVKKKKNARRRSKPKRS